MKHRFILIFALTISVLILTSPSFAEDQESTPVGLNDSNNISDSNPNSTQPSEDDPASKEITPTIISGTVNDCNTNDPFPGVNITVTHNGEYISSNLTGGDGTYLIIFNSSYNDFNVTASHVGHVSVTREINAMETGSKIRYGSADFKLGNDIYVDAKNGKSSYDGTSPVYEGGTKGPKQTISDALTVCVSEGTLHIAAGTYKGDSNRNLIIKINLNILGSGESNTTIDAENDGLIFWIKPGFSVNITNLNLTNGKASGTVSDSDDGDNGGGIYNEGVLNLENCYLYNNHAGNGNSPGTGSGIGIGGDGGGIYNKGTLTLTNCYLKNNYAGNGGDGNPGDSGKQGGSGGAIYNTGNLSIINCTFESNHAGNGGDRYNDHSGGAGGNGGAIYTSGYVTITDTIFEGNHAGQAGKGQLSGSGGAIYNTNSVSLTNCDLKNNYAGKGTDATAQITSKAGGNGGAAFNSGTLNITSCNFEGNYAGDGGQSSDVHDGSSGGNGGAIYNQGTLNITNGTFNTNHAGDGGDIESGSAAAGGNGGSAGAIYNTHTANISNSQFNGNYAGNGHKGGYAGNAGAIFSMSILNLTNSIFTSNYAGDGGASHDQKTGKSGGSGGAINNMGTSTLTNCTFKTNYAGDGGDCGDEYGSYGGYGGAIYNSLNLNIIDCLFDGNYAGVGGDASATKAAQKGGNGGCIYNDISGTVNISGSEIANSRAGNGGQAQANHNAGDGGFGGAIYNLNLLIISNTSIHNNQAGDGPNGGTAPSNGGLGGYGGGIYNDGTLTIENASQIYNNTAGDGGDASGTVEGTHGGFGGGIYNKHITTISDTAIYNNQAGNGGVGVDEQTGGYGGYGGGIYNEGTLTILANSQINNNTAGNGGDANDIGLTLAGLGGEGGCGGGIYNTGTLNITGNSTHPVAITGNTAGTGGLSQNDDKGGDGGKAGGLYNNASSCNLKYVIISDNKGGSGNTGELDTYLDIDGGDGGNGGGIYNNGTMNLEECNITSNEGGAGASGMNNPGQVNYGGGEGGHGGNGGGIDNSGKLTIINCYLISNKGGNGGNGGQSTYTFDGREGGSGGDGGAIYNTGQLTITGSVITDNSAGNGGKGGLGRLMKKTDDFSHVDYLIVGDPGNGGEGGNGGAIYNTGTISYITNTTILNNKAGNGGAGGIYEASTSLDIYGATPATPGKGGSGGGIFSTAGMISKLENVMLNNNSAGTGGNGNPCSTSGSETGGEGGNGGGLYIDNCEIDIINCEISGNRAGNGGNGSSTNVGSGYYPAYSLGNGGAGGTGGGIYLANNSYVICNINSTAINNNSAGTGGSGGIDDYYGTHSSNGGEGGNGGAISTISTLANNVELTILECTLTTNSAGSGGSPYLGGEKGAEGLGGGLYSNTNNYITINFSRILNNTPQAVNININFVYVCIMLENNWWGTNDGPVNQITGNDIHEINSTPWLVLCINSTPNSLSKNQTANITASLIMNSQGENTLNKYGLHVPDGIPVSFDANSTGNINPETNITTTGSSMSTFTPFTSSFGNVTLFATIDSQTVNTTVHIQYFDLDFTNTVNNTRPNVGETITFTVTVKNNGPDDVTGLTIFDLIPEGLSNISYSASNGNANYNLIVGMWTIGRLVSGTSVTLNLTGTVTSSLAGLNTTNYANITNANQFNINTNSSNASFYVPIVNITVLQRPWYYDTANNEFQTASAYNNVIVYLVHVTNTGKDEATGVVIKDVLGDGYQFIGLSTEGVGNASYDNLTKTINWNIATLPTTGKAILSVFCLVLGVGNNTPNLTANSSLFHVDQYDTPDSQKWSEWSIYVPTSADIQVNQTQEVSNESGGQYVTYTLTVFNNGPCNATNIRITDNFPTGLIDPVISGPGTHDWTSNQLVWTIASLSNGSSAVLSVKLKINGTGTFVNTASLTAQDESDWISVNNAQTCILTTSGNYTPEVNMRVIQVPAFYNTENHAYQMNSGYYKTIVYTVDVRNYGPTDATGVIVKEVLGDGYQFISLTTRGVGTAFYNITENSITWNVGYLPTGGIAYLSIYALVIATGNNTPDLTVNASLSDVDQFDLPGYAKWASYSIFVPVPLEISLADHQGNLYFNIISDNNSNFEIGDLFSLNFKLGNYGPSNATDVKVKIYIPEGLEFVNATVDSGICCYDAATRNVVWTLPLVEVGDPYLNLYLRALKNNDYQLKPVITSSTYLLSTGSFINIFGLTVTAAGEPADSGNSTGSGFGVSSVTAASNTVSMQHTGIPLMGMVLAVLMLISGLLIPRRK